MPNFVQAIYKFLVDTGTFFQSFLLLGIRLVWGWLFFQAGWSKLVNITPIIGFFHHLSIPWPEATAYIVAVVECAGGLCLLTGFASRLAAVPLICIMSTAYLTAHLPAVITIFNNPRSFIQQEPFNYLLASLLVFAFGPGVFSIDAVLKNYVFKIPEKQ